MSILRRDLVTTGAAALAFSGLARSVRAQTTAVEETYVNQAPGYGPLVKDPNGLFDLPEGFSYQVISQSGETMDDGLFVPQNPDGMGCFPLEGSRVALVRNHELRSNRANHRNWGPAGYHQERAGLLDMTRVYDTDPADGRALPGGTTTIIYDLATRRTVSQRLTLLGTSTNCAGGVTPWGSWLTCEESEDSPGSEPVTKPHGFVFEVPAIASGPVEPVPLKAMGRFEHEAVCVDPRTGIVYQTEDKGDSLFYRFIPTTPGKLAEGGKLQAMALKGKPRGDTRNHESVEWKVGDWREVEWIDLEDVEAPNNDLRVRGHAAGAALIARGEGIFFGDGELYMTATSGGVLKKGQVLRYVPSPDEGKRAERRRPGRLQLFLETDDLKTFNMGDNLVVAPWGHLIVCEDNYSTDLKNHLKGVTPDGKTYTIGRNVFAHNGELAGCCFSPDGEVLFMNIYYPGITLAIRGPWENVRSA